ncbi:MAG: HAD-IA family hydrolase [Terracidiphilus sp.]|jgi:beta-phosphoglucomutase family hydrolase
MNFDGAVFDMDGVITKTAVVHSSAWKDTFDEYLHSREAERKEPFSEFTPDDYLTFVDGRPRYKGVESFLLSRGIVIPYGGPNDEPETETVCGLGNRKNDLFNAKLENEGVPVFESTVQLVKQLLLNGIRVGVATSSKNCARVLEKAGIADLFETRVDGVLSAVLGLHGKPEPDIFTKACDNLGVKYSRAMIVEDAISGVQAGAKGRFGLTLGVARENNADELRRNGADLIVTDLSEISLDEIDNWFKSKGENAGSTCSEVLRTRNV